VGLKSNGKHHLLTYTDDVNLQEDNMHTKKRNTKTLIDASMEDGIEINIGKTKYMLLSYHQNAGQNQYIK
jgi:hypothetical protein